MGRQSTSTANCQIALLVCLCSVALGESVQRPQWLHALEAALPQFEAQRLDPSDYSTYEGIRDSRASGVLSPDGKWLVRRDEVVVDTEANGPYPSSLRLYDRTGKFVRDLTRDDFWSVRPYVWSTTSGALFIWSKHRAPDGLWKVDLATNSVFRPKLPWLPAPSGGFLRSGMEGIPIWSPTGDTYLVVGREQLSKTEVQYTVHRVWSPSGRHRKLATGYTPKWSPDGHWITFQRDGRATDARERWVMRSDGSGARRVLDAADVARQGAKDAMPLYTRYPCWIVGEPLLLFEVYVKTGEGLVDRRLCLADAKRATLKWIDTPGVIVRPESSSRDGRYLYLRVDGEEEWLLSFTGATH